MEMFHFGRDYLHAAVQHMKKMDGLDGTVGRLLLLQID